MSKSFIESISPWNHEYKVGYRLAKMHIAAYREREEFNDYADRQFVAGYNAAWFDAAIYA